jgi:hypothetical protein
MTATDGGPALDGAEATRTGGGVSSRAALEGPQLRTVLRLARVEASLLVRSWLVLAGMLVGGAVVWLLLGSVEPLWWNAGWEIGDGQLVLAMAVLVAAQLAAGRARRDGTAVLYRSCPATAGTRTMALVASVLGAAPASLVLIGAATALVQLRGAIGAPSVAVLAGGVLLVIAAGAVGIAIGTVLPHPLAGVLGALALFVISSQSSRFSGAVIWLIPWEFKQDDLRSVPGPLAGYPPAAAHALELAGIAVLVATAALAVTTRGARARAGLATGAVLALAAICFAGALQVRPVPSAELNFLVREAVDPASVQRCATVDQVRYCLYPGFGRQLPSLEEPVAAVLARVPARPPEALTIRQAVSVDVTDPALTDPTLTHGHPRRQVSRWDAQLQAVPGNVPTASVIYLAVGSWPAAGALLTDAHFDVALAAAEWAVRIPPQFSGVATGSVIAPCVPLDQAREAIAIWLAIVATHPPAAELHAGLGGLGNGLSIGTDVGHTFVRTWAYPGSNADYVTPQGVPQNTAAGYLLASAMTNLPEQKVAHVLADAWARWLDWHTTDAQLAAALGIAMPSVPAIPAAGHGQTVENGPGNGPTSPVCTSWQAGPHHNG